MASQEKAYLGLEWIVSLILAIIPFTNIVGGIITRVQRRKKGNTLIWAVLNCIPFFWPFFYVVDLVSMIVNRDLVWFA